MRVYGAYCLRVHRSDSHANHLAENTTADQWLERALHHEIDLYAQEVAQITFQFEEFEQGRRLRKLHEDVEIAVLPGNSSNIRTEEAKVVDVEPPSETGQVSLQGVCVSAKSSLGG